MTSLRNRGRRDLAEPERSMRGMRVYTAGAPVPELMGGYTACSIPIHQNTCRPHGRHSVLESQGFPSQ